MNEDGSYIGLFGYNMGTIRDTVYLSTVDQNRIMKKNVTGHRTIYIGGLVGYNNGTVNNCAVADMALQIYAYDYSTVYAGGLVGINYGAVTIRTPISAVSLVRMPRAAQSATAMRWAGLRQRAAVTAKCLQPDSPEAIRV